MSTNHVRAGALAGAALLLSLAAAACTAILGGTGYTAVPDEAAAPAADSGEDAPTPDCTTGGQSKAELESACTHGACQPFDNAARNTRCDGGTSCPTAEAVDAGAPDTSAPETSVPVDAGGAEAADDAATDASPPDASPPDAGATHPSCFALTQGPAGGALPQPVVYATGSTAIQPYMARVAQVIESLGLGSLVYLGAGSCVGVSAMTNPSGYPLVSIGKTATYYDPSLDTNGNVQSGTCAIDDAARVADMGISDVFPQTCDASLLSQGLPNNLHDFFGPVQVMEMVVPATSTQTTISAEAAYMVWGFGNESGVPPWTDDRFLLQRSATSGTQNMIAQAIGLSAGLWHGTKNAGSGNVLTALQNVKKGLLPAGGGGAPVNVAEMTIGILASDVADNNRQDLKPLAFQDSGQSCGWYPDSTQAAFDKRNVRDGHYPIWGPSHLIVYADANGNAKNPGADLVVKAMNGTQPDVLKALDIVQFYARSHIIPTCAMHVTRNQDGGNYTPFHPSIACSCYYDLQATGQTDCTPCKTDTDCNDAPNGARSCVSLFGIPPVGYCEQSGSEQ